MAPGVGAKGDMYNNVALLTIEVRVLVTIILEVVLDISTGWRPPPPTRSRAAR